MIENNEKKNKNKNEVVSVYCVCKKIKNCVTEKNSSFFFGFFMKAKCVHLIYL